MAQAEEFIAKFHGLEGHLIGQRQKKLYKLLKEFEPLIKDNEEALNAISTTLTPRNYLESLFIVDFLIYFKRVPDLIEYLKGGNGVYISKIAKQAWFFKSAFNETPVDQLVNEILPTMSYSVRVKILKNLSKYSSVERFDPIFDALVARYGISFASNFLLGCSASKIKAVLIDYKIKNLRSLQLITLHGKNPELIRQYFENHQFDFVLHKKFCIFLSAQDLKLLKELQDRYEFNLKLGRRRTKKFINAHRDDIVKNPADYIYKINMKTVFTKIGVESETLIKNTLPSKIQELDNDINVFKRIKYFIPCKYLYHIYFNIIQNHYNEKFCDHSDLITEDLIKIIPDHHERAKLAKIKIDESSENFINFVPYLTSEEAITLIKAKINLTSADRSSLVQAMIKTCQINKDLNSFLHVLKYFFVRHKNDGKVVILNFLNSIRNYFDVKDFNEEIWIALREIMAVYSLKYEMIHEGELKDILSKLEANSTLHSEFLMYCYNSVYGESLVLRLSYMEYMYKQGKLADESIVNFLCTTTLWFWGRTDYDNAFTAHLMKIAIANFEKIAKVRNLTLINFASELIHVIDQKLYRDQNITLYDFPILIEYFYKILDLGNHLLFTITPKFREIIFSVKDNPYRAKNLQYYCNDPENQYFHKDSDWEWFLLNDPQILLDNFDKLKSAIVESVNKPLFAYRNGRSKIPARRRFIQHCIKKFSHLGLDQLVIDYCKTILQGDGDKKAAIRCLSILLPAQDYITISSAYRPTNNEIDSVKNYQVVSNIAINFKYTNDYRVLDSVLNFLCDDFLKHTLISFPYLLYITPEIQLEKYLEFLRYNPSVSVRKHCFYFTRLLCDSNTIEKTFKTIAETEKDESLRQRFLNSLLNHFAVNPEQRYFEIIKLCFDLIKEEDTELVQKINKIIPKIALKYRAALIVYIWEYLERTITKPNILRDLKIQLLELIDTQCASDIPLDFVVAVIQENLSKSGKHLIPQDNVAQFAFTILSNKNEKTQILDSIFDVINKAENPRELYWIHNTYTCEILKLKQDQSVDFLQHYITYWRSKLDPVEDFKRCLYLFFVQLKAEFHAAFSLEKISDRIIQFYEQVISDYGLCVLKFLKEALVELLQYFTIDDITDYHFYYYIINNCKSTAIVVIIIDILPSKEESNSCKLEVHKKIVEKLKTFKEPPIKINARKFCDQ